MGLRAVEVNGDGEAYHRYRRQQVQERLYGFSVEAGEATEEWAFKLAA